MNIKYSWYLSKKNVAKNKNNIFIITLLTICFLLIVLSFSFVKTLDNYLVKGIMNDISYKTLFVGPKPDVETEEELISKLKKIEHVIDVFPDRENSYVLSLSKLGKENVIGSFFIVGISDENMIEVSHGRKISNENEIICPNIFYPNDDLESKTTLKPNEFFQMQRYLGEKVLSNYFVYIDDENRDIRSLELSIVGTYSNNPSYIDENICYASRTLIRKIFDEAYQHIDLSQQLDSIIVRVDDIKNINRVIREIEKDNYFVTPAVYVDHQFINSIKYLSYTILFITTIISICLISYINKKGINDKKSEINVFRGLGYSKKEISRILFLENLYLGVLTSLISCVIVFLIWLTLMTLISSNPLIFQKIPVSVSGLSILISIFIVCVSLLITSNIYKRKVLTKNIITNIKE